MNKLIIHNVRKEFFHLDLAEYQLTFDDGLYSQYYYLPLFKKNRVPIIFFITTGLIQEGKDRAVFDGQHLPYVKSREYMYEAFIKNNFGQFMRVEELKQLANEEDVVIGAHSHFHDIILTRHPLKKPLSRWKLEHLPCLCKNDTGLPMNRRSKLAYQGYSCPGIIPMKRSIIQWLDYVKYDTESCLLWFEKHLGFQPSSYSFPFNEYTPELVEILQTYGFKHFYNGASGDNKQIFSRIDIDKLIK
ncbi:MAG: polysaccharide deacetylase family protein [Desulfobacterales bacterium]